MENFKVLITKTGLILVCLVVALVFGGCSSDKEEELIDGCSFYTIDVTSSGLPEDTEVSSSSISANIPSEGLSFSLQGHGKYASYLVILHGYVVSLSDGNTDLIKVPTPVQEKLSFTNDYMNVSYRDDNIVDIEILPNISEKERVIHMFLGYPNADGMCDNSIDIVQSGVAAIDREDA